MVVLGREPHRLRLTRVDVERLAPVGRAQERGSEAVRESPCLERAPLALSSDLPPDRVGATTAALVDENREDANVKGGLPVHAASSRVDSQASRSVRRTRMS